MATKDQTYWVGFDLGGTKMLVTIFDRDFTPVARKRKRTKGHEGPDAGVSRIVATIQQALDEAEVPLARVGGIGVGCPSPVDLTRGIVLEAVNLGWKELPLKELLEKEFRCPVHVVNDVDAGVYGEYRFGAATGSRCAAGIFPGTGIGGGCVYEGRILHGAGSSCFEIGHIQVRENGPRCGCGRRGCLEAIASRLAISAEAAKAAVRGEAPHLMEQAGANLRDIRSGILAEAIEAGDTAIEEIVRDAAAQIGVAVATVVHLVSPDTIVLGGGLVEAMPKLIVGEVLASAKKRVMASFADSFRVVAAELGDDASVFGSAGWAQMQCSGKKPGE